jgi:hypothetical protein
LPEWLKKFLSLKNVAPLSDFSSICLEIGAYFRQKRVENPAKELIL